MNWKIKKIWNCVNSLLVSLVVVLSIALAGVRLVGLDIYVVLSGSMEPAYKTGSVIYVKNTDLNEIAVGDVITYRLDNDTAATHRVMELTKKDGDLAFITKGDANEIEDASAVPASRVIGTPIFTIPYLGYLVAFIQTPSGRYASIAAAAAILLMMILPDMIFGDKKN